VVVLWCGGVFHDGDDPSDFEVWGHFWCGTQNFSLGVVLDGACCVYFVEGGGDGVRCRGLVGWCCVGMGFR
jgi:hypothetical protein